MSRRGKNPSRAERTQPRATARRSMERVAMQIPAAVKALMHRVQQLPCLVDPECTVDHLRRKERRRG